MRKPSKNIFVGHCDRCGEAYEAQTSLEDLDGLSFNCKKVVCSGKVELRYASSHEFHSPNLEKNPRRYC